MYSAPTSSNEMQVIALISFDESSKEFINKCDFRGRTLLHFATGTELISSWELNDLKISAVISNSEILGPHGASITEEFSRKSLPRVPVFLLVNHLNPNLIELALHSNLTDLFAFPLQKEDIEKRVNFTIENWSKLREKFKKKPFVTYKTPLPKRIFDIIFSTLALILLFPVFLIVYLLIKFESPGPAFYYSYRVGTGYRIFKFYKFRSMYINADQRLKDYKHLNQYSTTVIEGSEETASSATLIQTLCSDCAPHNKCQFPLFADNTTSCEKDYNRRKSKGGSAFIKIKNDPRVTRVGEFIRNSSVDELPQLWNVFIGDMSIVGNRPLPLYEAEKLTVDKYVLRFNAPAGITGLWQVEKRGKGDMNEDERLSLDNSYALNHGFTSDLLVILKTIPALLQKENV